MRPVWFLFPKQDISLWMVRTLERHIKGLLGLLQILESQVGVIQLVVLGVKKEYRINQVTQFLFIFGHLSPGPGLGAICKHQKGCFTRLRAGAGVGEERLIDLRWVTVGFFDRLRVLIMGIHRAVVFSDEVNDPVRQAIFLCQVNTIGDMADDGLSAGQGIYVIVWV